MLKKLITVIIIVLPAAALLPYALKPVLHVVIKNSIAEQIPGAVVKIAGIETGFSGISVKGLNVEKKNTLQVDVPDLYLRFSVPGLLKGALSEIRVNNPVLKITAPEKKFESLKKLFLAGKKKGKGIFIQVVSINNLEVEVRTKDILFKGKVNLAVDLGAGAVKTTDIVLDSFSSMDINAKNISIKSDNKGSKLAFGCGTFKYRKFVIDNAESSIEILPDNTVGFNNFKADFAGGIINGLIKFEKSDILSYRAKFDFRNIDLSSIMKSFEVDNKLDLSGRMEGSLEFAGDEKRINAIAGDFVTDAPGGIMYMKDDSMLKSMAEKYKQDINILLESFRNYHYNKGHMKVRLEANDIVMDAGLEGEAGNRNLIIVLHEFQK